MFRSFCRGIREGGVPCRQGDVRDYTEIRSGRIHAVSDHVTDSIASVYLVGSCQIERLNPPGVRSISVGIIDGEPHFAEVMRYAGVCESRKFRILRGSGYEIGSKTPGIIGLFHRYLEALEAGAVILEFRYDEFPTIERREVFYIGGRSIVY